MLFSKIIFSEAFHSRSHATLGKESLEKLQAPEISEEFFSEEIIWGTCAYVIF